MTFAEIHRALKGYSNRMDGLATLAREIAYYCYAQVGKRPLAPKDVFWPIGEIKDPGVTQEYTDMIYKKYGKLHEN
jgi:hypothetical protein